MATLRKVNKTQKIQRSAKKSNFDQKRTKNVLFAQFCHWKNWVGFHTLHARAKHCNIRIYICCITKSGLHEVHVVASKLTSTIWNEVELESKHDTSSNPRHFFALFFFLSFSPVVNVRRKFDPIFCFLFNGSRFVGIWHHAILKPLRHVTEKLWKTVNLTENHFLFVKLLMNIYL